MGWVGRLFSIGTRQNFATVGHFPAMIGIFDSDLLLVMVKCVVKVLFKL
jgi:hypothetical protein